MRPRPHPALPQDAACHVRQGPAGLTQLIAQIDFNSEHYYNLYSPVVDEAPGPDPAEEVWTDVSALRGDIVKIRGELTRMRLGVEQIRMPAIEAVGLDAVTDQLRSVEGRLRMLSGTLDTSEEQSRIERLLKDILTVMDTLDRVFGLATEVMSTLPKGMGQGLESVYQLMTAILAKYGLKKMELARGSKFNPEHEMAMGTEPDDELPDGVVKYVMLEGYLLGTKVFRTAQVVVVKSGVG